MMHNLLGSRACSGVANDRPASRDSRHPGCEPHSGKIQVAYSGCESQSRTPLIYVKPAAFKLSCGSDRGGGRARKRNRK